MDVGDWEGEVKLAGDLGKTIIGVGVTGAAVGVAVNVVGAVVEVVQCYIREYGSTLYVGMTREKNGGRIKRVH